MMKVIIKISSLLLFPLLCFSQSNINYTINVDGLSRTYLVHSPGSGVELPLIINMHGVGSTPEEQQEWAQMDPIANSERFLVVYPEAKRPSLTWEQSDTSFIAAMLDQLAEDYSINPNQIYATGFSGGGFMAHYLGQVFNDRIAAIGSIAGLIPFWFGTQAPLHSVPVIMIHNTLDETIPFGDANDGVAESIQRWKAWNRCTADLRIDSISQVSQAIRETYTNCEDSTEIQLISFTSELFGGHFLPWEACCGFSSAQEQWNFFKRFKLNRGVSTATKNSKLNSPSFQVFPNPTSSVLQIKSSELIQRIEVFNINGTLIQAFKLKNQNSLVLDLSNLVSGTYVLKCYSKEGRSYQFLNKL